MTTEPEQCARLQVAEMRTATGASFPQMELRKDWFCFLTFFSLSPKSTHASQAGGE